MAQQGWQPGQPLAIKPTIITAGRRNTYWGRDGGGYSGSGDGWGLQEGPRRGEGDPSRFRQFDFPSATADFIGEQKNNQSLIDTEYQTRFATLNADTEREFEEKQLTAKSEQLLTDPELSGLTQKITLELIEAKKTQYTSTAPIMYGLYDQNPFYLMENLTYTKLLETLASSNVVEALSNTYELYDNVWRSAQELKALSLSIEILAGKLPALAKARQQAESLMAMTEPDWSNLQIEYLKTISEELEVHVQLLPEFLQVELSSLTGSVVGLPPEQALTHYKNILDQMIAEKMAAIRPVEEPELRSHNGLKYRYTATNPKVSPPLSKPELEGLNHLIYLQRNTELGVRWLSHHDHVLKSESVRFLINASNAFVDLTNRAQLVATEQSRIKAVRAENTFRNPAPASAAQAVVMTSVGTIAIAEEITITLQAAIRAAVVTLGEFAASTASGLLVGVSALIYSPKLANGELAERYALGTPVSTIAPELNEASITSAVNGTIDLPVRISSKTAMDGQSEVFVVNADGKGVPSKVKVVAATYDAEQRVYTVTTTDSPPRTLTWTPIIAPGNSSTTLPGEQSEPPIYAGATATPIEGRVDSFPEIGAASFDDFITVFPVDSGLPPMYVMFRDRREDPGVATGMGQPVTGNWLGAASENEGAPIPSQIADQLRGKGFKNFRAFRETLWKTAGNDPILSAHFKKQNTMNLLKGKSPAPRESEQVGGRVKFEIHHKIHISKGGAVYDIDNMVIVTPKRHIEIHKAESEI